MAIFASEMNRFVRQDVAARLDYAEDWSDFMALIPGDTIVSSVWSGSPSGLLFSDSVIDGALVSSFIEGGTVGQSYQIANTIDTQNGRSDVRYFFLNVFDGGAELVPVVSTALFNRFTSVAEFKASSLSFLDQSFPIDRLSDQTVWDNLVAAEAEAARVLNVLLQPTKIIPDHAEQTEIDALVAAGTPYLLESGYDFDPANWQSSAWGFTLLRHTPVISIESVKITYPAPVNTILDVPKEWLSLDNKYGHLRFVPAGTMMGFGPMTTFVMNAITSGRMIPEALQIRYFSGIDNAATKYPDLIGLVRRMATMRMVKDGFIPTSASISSDGLSQSQSFDSSKWQDGIDADLEKMRDRIVGIRMDIL